MASFVCGIAGMIASSVDGNNVGRVTTFGVFSAIGALVLLATSASSDGHRIDVFDEADAEQLERQIASLVADGIDESNLRRLVGDAFRVGRRTS
ncbi:MAG: hypothetical protein ABI590_03255 [Ilumatobacteraceae bacterium]